MFLQGHRTVAQWRMRVHVSMLLAGLSGAALALPQAAQALPPSPKPAPAASGEQSDHPSVDALFDPNAQVEGIIQRRTQPMVWKAQRTRADLPRGMTAAPPAAPKGRTPIPRRAIPPGAKR